MIAFLRGSIIELNLDSVVLNVGGVGYDVHCPLQTLEGVALGQELPLWISTQVREDAITLFGFSDRAQKQFYLSLLKVNGIGPKMALNIMSGASREALVQLIENEDVSGLSKLPKVGKKTAEQMILTLKGKLIRSEEQELLPPLGSGSQIMSALVNLGFRSSDVEKIISKLPKEVSFEEGFKQGLSQLAGGGKNG